MIRAALYARYSTDMQSEASIEDQFRICRERAEREGWNLVETYHDRAQSGASLMRAGIQALLSDARAGQFDVVIAEALDRLSRDQEDIAHVHKQLRFSGVKILTLSEGEIDEMHIGLKGTMNSLFLKDLAKKTHRGLQGRALDGKSAGGKAYGYKTIRQFDERGALIDEERVIVPEEAAVVVRIFEEYAKGKSPRAIAHGLNKEGIAGPATTGWGSSTINGNRKRGTGILNNELYVGRMVWNKLRYMKDPSTGKRVSRLNPQSEWVITELPDMRIVPQELWDKVKDYQASLDRKPTMAHKQRPPKLLSGLLKCGCCGSGYSMVSQTQYGCYDARNKGSCDNRLTISRKKVEQQVLSVLSTRLMNPELTRVFCEEYTAHIRAFSAQSGSYPHDLK